MLRSDFCDYSDAYIVVKGTITVTNPKSILYDKKLAFKKQCTVCFLHFRNKQYTHR